MLLAYSVSEYFALRVYSSGAPWGKASAACAAGITAPVASPRAVVSKSRRMWKYRSAVISEDRMGGTVSRGIGFTAGLAGAGGAPPLAVFRLRGRKGYKVPVPSGRAHCQAGWRQRTGRAFGTCFQSPGGPVS